MIIVLLYYTLDRAYISFNYEVMEMSISSTVKYNFIRWLRRRKRFDELNEVSACCLTECEFMLVKMCATLDFRNRKIRKVFDDFVNERISAEDALNVLAPYYAAKSL